MNKLTRREFLHLSTIGLGTVVVANSLTGCVIPTVLGGKNSSQETNAIFAHGIASGDPLSDRVILWTRATPLLAKVDEVLVSFQVALDSDFSVLVTQGAARTSKAHDYTIKIDVTGLLPDTTYYYRFLTRDNVSPVGRTRTLPVGDINQVKLIVVSCSYYSAGYFHVFKEAAKVADANAVLHLGDYIYEYGPGIYADEEAEAMGRVMEPAHEIISLDDYRHRYAQTRSDADLQSLHSTMPMIAIWDDHEVCNDTWSDGAENHTSDEGDFDVRRLVALQAYAEWMPIRPPVEDDIYSIQRDFQFGNLVNLSLLDTRLIARDQQLDYATYTNKESGAFNGESFYTDLNNPERTLLGQEQMDKLSESLSTGSTWHVLGQQVLMGAMYLPAPIVSQQISSADYGGLAQKVHSQPDSLSEEELGILNAPSIPYNLDAWDGYPAERTQVLQMAVDMGVNLVVLAGDTHNAWSNDLLLDGKFVGVEFATSSVTSPGLETYVNTTADDEPGTVAAINGLKYCNLVERGFMSVTFTQESVEAEWIFVDSVKSEVYGVLNERTYKRSIKSKDF